MAAFDKKFQRDVQKIWKTTQKRLRVLGDEAVQLAHKGEKEIIRATKLGRLQIDMANIRHRRDLVHQDIGRRIVALTRQKKVKVPAIQSQLARITMLSRQIRSREEAIAKVRGKAPRRRHRRSKSA